MTWVTIFISGFFPVLWLFVVLARDGFRGNMVLAPESKGRSLR